MKKQLLLLALLSGAATVAQAQSAIPAGTISLGGSIGYFSQGSEIDPGSGSTIESSESTFHVTPSVGFFIADNLAVGLDLGYRVNGTDETDGGTTVSTTPYSEFRIGPYAQYYKMVSDQFGVLGTLGLGFQHSSTQSSSSSDEIKGNGFYASLTPGVIFFPIPKFGISASIGSLGYQRLSLSTDDMPDDVSYHTSSFGAGFGLDQLQFGGTYYFGR